MASLDGNSPELLARAAWIAASEFCTLSEAEVLREVAKRTAEVKTKGGAHPLVLLDLDGTLYEVAPRTHAILREWAASPDSSSFPEARLAIQHLKVAQVGFSLKDTFQAMGLELGSHENFKAWESAKTFWFDRFFTSEYLPHDLPYKGAREFAQEIYDLGAEIVYLTGRDEPNMGEGTRANLVRDGFPWNLERTHLMLKRDVDLSDIDHKRAAADAIRSRGTLIASFENEPQNLVALQEVFPDAMHVFVDTAYSDRGARAIKGLYRIRGFE